MADTLSTTYTKYTPNAILASSWGYKQHHLRTYWDFFGRLCWLFTCSCCSSIFLGSWCRGWWWFHVGRRIMLQLHQYPVHPRQVCGLARLWPLDYYNRWFLIFVLLPSRFLDVRHLIGDEFCNSFPVMFISLSMELFLAGKE